MLIVYHGSVVVHTFEQLCLQDQLANFSQILSVASLGLGGGGGREAALGFGADQIKIGYHGNRKLPLTYNGKKMVSPHFLTHL